MREIKFRAWSIDGKKMYNWEQMQTPSHKLYKYFWWDDMYKIMQYIGKKDKKNTEIYHFDILENESGRRVLVVYFMGPKYCGWDLDGLNEKGSVDQNRWWEGWTVIGDKFRNPELLKEK